MKQQIPSRRSTAGKIPLLVSLWLCLLFSCAASALAQRGGSPGGMAMGQRPMGISGASRQMMGNPGGNLRTGRFAGELGSRVSAQPRMGLQLGLGGRWWDDHHTMRKLRISPDQQQRMDAIFEADKPALLDLYTRYQHQEAGLASLSHANLQDESKVFAAIDRVSQARSDLEKENTHMLLQIRQQLDPQQIDALDREISKSH